jgi:hypothetical protein
MLDTKDRILDEIDLGDGYIIGKILDEDFSAFQIIINKQYQERILSLYPEQEVNIRNTNIHEYHDLNFCDHKKLWPKESRTFLESDVLIFKESKFFKELENKFGQIIITNEDKTRSQEIYWRLVRPNQSDDVGPLHADSWFWTLHNGPIEKGYRRLKIWVSVFNQSGKNGLRLIPGSQKKTYEFKGETRDGKTKPILDPLIERDNSIILAPTSPGQFILFHDNLIHGGGAGGDKTRVSFEMTLMLKD